MIDELGGSIDKVLSTAMKQTNSDPIPKDDALKTQTSALSSSSSNAFHTPPISNAKFDLLQSINSASKGNSDQYSQVSATSARTSLTNRSGDSCTSSSGTSGSSAKSNTVNNNQMHIESLITEEDIEREVNVLKELPPELTRSIDLFILDLKQPKYSKPLSSLQLASVFQHFYANFDKQCFHYFTNLQNQNTGASAYMNARETLSSGLSGLFARSRSSSVTSTAAIRGRRSSSLLSSDSNTNMTQLLTPDEINKQLKNNELNNLKIDKYMEFCEKDVFKRIIDVGTSAIKPNEQNLTPNGSDLTIAGTKSNKKSPSNKVELFKLSQIFKNSPEFEKYSRLMNKKLKCLDHLDSENIIDLKAFLDVPSTLQVENYERSNTIFNDLIYNSVSPCDKLKLLLKLHHSIGNSSQKTSNDEYLSILIYLVIRTNPKDIFLNTQFIKMFRYKKKLVENELFALTNLEASLSFIDSITVTDFSEDIQGKLEGRDKKLLEVSLSKKIALPIIDLSDSNSNLDQLSELPLTDQINRSGSYEGLRTVIDSSVKNILGRLKPYAYTKPISRSPSITSLEPITADLKEDKEKDLSLDHLDSTIIAMESPLKKLVISTKDNKTGDWKKFKDYKFEDLTINELREVFDIYKELSNSK